MKKKYTSISKNYIQTNLKEYWQLVNKINIQHKKLSTFTDNKLQTISHQLISGATLSDEIIIEAFALVKEVVIRRLKITPYDVQLLGAIALSRNKLIQMQTGEGKTLTAVFPAYLHAFNRKGLHVLTFNDYLAKRDALWMKPVYDFLGLSVAYVNEGMSKLEKKEAYQADITYATAKEVGFDYLRSFIAYDKDEIVLRPFNYAIVDEADAILIDEARNPLVLAGDLIKASVDIKMVSKLVLTLEEKVHYDRNHDLHNIYLTERGIEYLQKQLKVENMLDEENQELLSAVNLALHAKILLHKDIHYVVRDNEIKLVDDFTGRIVEDRKWRNGLQSAVEAKEKLPLKSEGNILNSITLQHLIHKYPNKSAMTATAQISAEEFDDFYALHTVVIPSNRVCQRIDYSDEIFVSKMAKNKAIVDEVQQIHKKGQPILIGTSTIKESEELYKLIKQHHIPCQVLNAKNDELESKIIANAGKLGAVTISTNMAGRGTDILLGGAEGENKGKIRKLGGLYVIGTNRHESLRVDNQLRGRAGRQGDEGMSRFFISFEDDLMESYELKKNLPSRYLKLTSEEAIKSKYLKKYIDHTQRVIEGQAYEQRKNLFAYSNFVEKQRQIIQTERQELLKKQGELSELEDKEKLIKIFIYDKYWALHLDYLQQVRDSIHLVRLGGQNPIQEFHKKADASFKELNENIDAEIETRLKELQAYPDMDLNELNIKRPSSTWTYLINDNPFGNKLGIMLLDNSMLGFQVDPVSGLFLMVYAVIEKFKSMRSKRKKD